MMTGQPIAATGARLIGKSNRNRGARDQNPQWPKSDHAVGLARKRDAANNVREPLGRVYLH
jgi:hypothetical protein